MDEATRKHLNEVLGDLKYNHRAVALEVTALESAKVKDATAKRNIAQSLTRRRAQITVLNLQITALESASPEPVEQPATP